MHHVAGMPVNTQPLHSKADALSPFPVPAKHGQGVRRCLVVRPLVDDPSPPKDANEALLAGRDIREFLEGER